MQGAFHFSGVANPSSIYLMIITVHDASIWISPTKPTRPPAHSCKIGKMADRYTEDDLMTRLPSEVKRLNEQFDLMTKNIGYVLHPSLALPPAPRIADMGTGTAAFLRRLQPTLPDASLEGFDISPALFPPAEALPPNVSLKVLDLKQPFPEHMLGRYDLVHARMVFMAMLPGDWEPAVHNFMSLLKPGGYLQWEECDFGSAEFCRESPNSRDEMTKFMCEQFKDAAGGRVEHGWNTLPGIMRSAGLDPVVSDVSSSARVAETRGRLTASLLTLVSTWAEIQAQKGMLTFPGNRSLEATKQEVEDEIRSGCYYKYGIHVVCGRKPSA
ncbi:S-adenosyl-L-methionine-dependent methyltransferase [Xylariaceae sp. FL0804]|nr:S-adenosyl-L-methionine-dependent methyltransferase [Xylariaceae sp. FL0804]